MSTCQGWGMGAKCLPGVLEGLGYTVEENKTAELKKINIIITTETTAKVTFLLTFLPPKDKVKALIDLMDNPSFFLVLLTPFV